MSKQELFSRFIVSQKTLHPVKSSFLSKFTEGLKNTSINLTIKNTSFNKNSKIIPNSLPVLGSFLTVGVITVDFSLPGEYTEDVPNYIRATQETDLHIVEIHKAIRCIVGSEIYMMPTMKTHYNKLYNYLHSSFLTPIEASNVEKEMSAIYNRLNSISTGDKWSNYVKVTRPIFEEYLEIASDEIKGVVSFNGKVKKEIEDGDVIAKRNDLIAKYLEVARTFINIEVINLVGDHIDVCPSCKESVDEFDTEYISGTMTCSCGYQRIGLSKDATYRDSARVNAAMRTKYDDLTTFIKSFDNFMGINVPEIPDKLYTMLDGYFEKVGMNQLIGKNVKESNAILENGKREGTSVQILITALDSTNNSSMYSYYNYIGHKYWGWQLPDISKYKDIALHHYEMTQKVYERTRERDSSLNVQIRLYYHLNICGYKCNQNDFKFLTHRPSLEYHHKQLGIMSSECNLPIIPII